MLNARTPRGVCAQRGVGGSARERCATPSSTRVREDRPLTFLRIPRSARNLPASSRTNRKISDERGREQGTAHAACSPSAVLVRGRTYPTLSLCPPAGHPASPPRSRPLHRPVATSRRAASTATTSRRQRKGFGSGWQTSRIGTGGTWLGGRRKRRKGEPDKRTGAAG